MLVAFAEVKGWVLDKQDKVVGNNGGSGEFRRDLARRCETKGNVINPPTTWSSVTSLSFFEEMVKEESFGALALV